VVVDAVAPEALPAELRAVVAVLDAVRRPVAQQPVVRLLVVEPLVVDVAVPAVEALQPVELRPVVERKVEADVAVAPRQQRRRKNWVKASTRSRAGIAWSLSSLKTMWS
jgi:hypothetical protein